MVASLAIKGFVLVVASLPFAQAQTIHDGNQVVGRLSAILSNFYEHTLILQ